MSNINTGDNQKPIGYDPNTGEPIYASAPETRKPIGYDPNTGAPIYEAQPETRKPIGYDPNTGAPIYEAQPVSYDPQPVVPQKKAPVGIIIGAIAASLALIAAILCFVLLRSTPMENISKAMDTTIDAIYARNDGMTMLKKMEDNQSLSVSFAAEDVAALTEAVDAFYYSDLGLDDLDISISGSASANKSNETSANMSLNVEGFSTNVQYYISPDEIIFSAPSILSNNYGLSLTNLEERLENSIFAPDSGSWYAASKIDYEELLAILDAYSSIEAQKNPMTLQDLKNTILTAIEENEDANPGFDSAKETLSIGGKDIKCTVYTASINSDNMAEICDVVSEVIEDTMPELVDMYRENTGYDIVAKLERISDRIRYSNAFSKVKLKLAVYKDALVFVGVSSKDFGSLELDFGADPANSDRMSATLTDDGYNDTLIYERTENTKNSYRAEIRYERRGDSDYVPFTMKWDKINGEFSFSYNNVWDGFTLDGVLTVDGKTMSIAPESIYSFYNETRYALPGLSFEVSADSKVEKPSGGYIDILDMTEDDVDDLLDEIEAIARMVG